MALTAKQKLDNIPRIKSIFFQAGAFHFAAQKLTQPGRPDISLMGTSNNHAFPIFPLRNPLIYNSPISEKWY